MSVNAKRTMWASSVTTVKLDTMTTLSALSVLVTGGDLLITTSVTPTLASAPAKEASGERTVTSASLAITVFLTVVDVHATQQASSPSQDGLLETVLLQILDSVTVRTM